MWSLDSSGHQVLASGDVDLDLILGVLPGNWELPCDVDMDSVELDESAIPPFPEGPMVLATGRIKGLALYAGDDAAWPECRIKVGDVR